MILSRTIFFFFCSFVFLTVSCHGNSFADDQSEKRGMNFFAFPVMTYSSDTGAGAGVAAMKTYKQYEKVSYIGFSGIHTQKRQSIISLKWDHYTPRKPYHTQLNLTYAKMPAPFFGIGNDTSNENPEKYTPEYIEARFFIERNIYRSLKLKGQMYGRVQSLLKYEKGGIFESGVVPWHAGRRDYGPGIALVWDTRDNTTATNSGVYAEAEFQTFPFNSEGAYFEIIKLETRGFRDIGKRKVLAGMINIKKANGDIPFYFLPALGGEDRLRGYEAERFSGKIAGLVQTDMRFAIYGPLDGAVFYGGGCAGENFGDLFENRWHSAFGAGLRFYLNRNDNISLRADAAAGKDSKGIYVGFGEAY